MVPLHVATLTIQRELPKHESLPYLCIKKKTMVATLTAQRELPKYVILFCI